MNADLETLRKLNAAEDRALRARTKLGALAHLLSQYHGELEFADATAHGVAWLLDDIASDLAEGFETPEEEKKGGAK